jgi:general secretion pathway protein A
MFHEYFGIAEDPFSITPDTRYLFQSERHRNAFAHLLYGVADAGGFVQLTGEIGTGKTLLCRNLLAQLPEEVNVALIFNPRLTPLELVASICDELKVHYPLGCGSIKEIVDFLNAYLLEGYRQGRRTVVIIDEAQNLSYDALEQVRLLTNLETEKQKLLQIILVGQPELKQVLGRPELKQLAQRITARYHLMPLSADETRDYILHRLRVAGADARLFSADALRQLYRLSGGVPRLINVLCGRAMLAAYGADQETIDGRLVQRVAKELAGEEDLPAASPRWGWGVAAVAVAGLAIAGYFYFKAVPVPASVSATATESTVQATRTDAEMLEPLPEQEVTGGQQPSPNMVVGLTPASLSAPAPKPAPEAMADAAAAVEPAAQGDSASGLETVSASTPPAPPDAGDASLSLMSLLGDQNAAFSTLFAYWQTVYPQDDDTLSACERAEKVGLSCIYGRGDWLSLERYNRPAVIELLLDDGHRYHVVVAGLDKQRVTLDLASRRLNFSRQEIELLWTGSYIVLWQPPRLTVEPLIQGMQGRDVAWLVSRLDRIEGVLSDYNPDRVQFDETLKQRVMAFQHEQGLIADGIVGRQTIIQLSVAVVDAATPALMRDGS